MIDEKKIEEATVEQLENLGTYGLDEVDLGKEQLVALYREEDVKAMFKAGINRFQENLWHDASEEPKENSTVLLVAEFDDEPYTAFCCEGLFQIKDAHHDDNNYLFQKDISKWAYIEDLMKGGK